MKKNPQIPHILVIEDEEPIAELLKYSLEKHDFTVSLESNGAEGLAAIEASAPDLLLVDWMLPDRSGIDIIRSIRDNSAIASLPIVMLTARGEENDRLKGLDSGADDYIVKPFSPKELVARIRALLRRTRPVFESKKLNYYHLDIDLSQQQATSGGRPIALGPTEFRLLAYLMEHPERVYSREQLLNHVWGQDVYVEERTVDACVKRIRKAMSMTHPSLEDYIKTKRGIGYLLSVNALDEVI